jgi:predicted nucleic acid-binding Zn ribbon protein
MPDRSYWYFCRSCAHRGLFVVSPDAEVECPECRKRYVTTIMRRQDVGWAKAEKEKVG